MPDRPQPGTRDRPIADVAVVVWLLTSTNVAAYFAPGSLQTLIVPLGAVVLVVLGRHSGLSWTTSGSGAGIGGPVPGTVGPPPVWWSLHDLPAEPRCRGLLRSGIARRRIRRDAPAEAGGEPVDRRCIVSDGLWRRERSPVRRQVSELAAGERQLPLGEVVGELRGLAGRSSEVPAVHECLDDAQTQRDDAGNRPNGHAEHLLEHAGLAKCREQRISGLAVGGYRIVAQMVDPLQPRKVCERRRLPPAEDAGEQAVASDKVVDQVADLPVGAGGGAGLLLVPYGGYQLLGASKSLSEFVDGCGRHGRSSRHVGERVRRPTTYRSHARCALNARAEELGRLAAARPAAGVQAAPPFGR